MKIWHTSISSLILRDDRNSGGKQPAILPSVPRTQNVGSSPSPRQIKCLVNFPRRRLLANFFVLLVRRRSRLLPRWLCSFLSRRSCSCSWLSSGDMGSLSGSSGHVSSRWSCMPASVAASSLEHGSSPLTTNCCSWRKQKKKNINPLRAKHIFTFCVISPHWYTQVVEILPQVWQEPTNTT